MMRGISALVAFLLAITAPVAARADPPPENEPLRWDEDRPRFRPGEYAATAVVGTAAWIMYYQLPPQREPHWVGGILFDDAVRNALRVRSPSALKAVWAASDAVDVSLIVIVLGGDSFAVPLLRGSLDVAVQLSLMDLESFAVSSVITFSLYDSIGRARPSYEDCQHDPSGVGCDISPTASFPSGHTAEAFVTAGMSCANHAYVPIYGSRLFDTLACARDLTLATADSLLRVIGDRHYMTDVLAGAAIGFSVGYGMPTLLHYRASHATSRASWTLSPMIGSAPGVILTGSFF